MDVSMPIGELIVMAPFILFGVLSLLKPESVGADFYWRKHRGNYVPSWRRVNNPQYHRQIRIVGVGLIVAPIIVIIIRLL